MSFVDTRSWDDIPPDMDPPDMEISTSAKAFIVFAHHHNLGKCYRERYTTLSGWIQKGDYSEKQNEESFVITDFIDSIPNDDTSNFSLKQSGIPNNTKLNIKSIKDNYEKEKTVNTHRRYDDSSYTTFNNHNTTDFGNIVCRVEMSSLHGFSNMSSPFFIYNAQIKKIGDLKIYMQTLLDVSGMDIQDDESGEVLPDDHTITNRTYVLLVPPRHLPIERVQLEAENGDVIRINVANHTTPQRILRSYGVQDPAHYSPNSDDLRFNSPYKKLCLKVYRFYINMFLYRDYIETIYITNITKIHSDEFVYREILKPLIAELSDVEVIFVSEQNRQMISFSDVPDVDGFGFPHEVRHVLCNTIQRKKWIENVEKLLESVTTRNNEKLDWSMFLFQWNSELKLLREARNVRYLDVEHMLDKIAQSLPILS